MLCCQVAGADPIHRMTGPMPTVSRGFLAPVQTPQGRFIILAAFLFICLFTGGSSRADAGLLLVLRPTTVIALAALLIASPGITLNSIRALALLLGAFAVTMAVQLIPLPPELWSSLPGHERYADAAAIAGVTAPWRPLSLTPDLTLNALLSLIPVVLLLLGYIGAGRYRAQLILFPIVLAVVSMVVGVVQIAGGANSPAYLYRPTSDFLPVGLFANRNHQAVMLALALPVLAVWSRDPGAGRYRMGIALGIGLLLVPVILVTGSRAGAVLAAVGLVAAAAFALPGLKRWRIPRLAYIAGAALLVCVIIATIVAGRAFSVDRITDSDNASSQLRWSTLPIVWQMTRDYLPFGIGYGAFDPVFRSYEPDALLKPTFFNRAHNDLLETILSGGIPALLVAIAFAGWWVRQAARAWRGGMSYQAMFPRLGAVITAMLILASAVDYPLRAPLAGIVFALGCCWLAQAGRLPDASTSSEL